MKNYLMTIGIDDYRHQSKLFNCVKDVRDFSDILIDSYGFENEDSTELVNSNATSKKIQDTIVDFSEKLGSNDSFIIFFSGHGHFDKRANTGYWIPYEGTEEYTSWIPNHTILSLLDNIKCKHIVLIVDSCFSHSLLLTNTPKSNDEYNSKSSRWCLASAYDESWTTNDPSSNSDFASSILEFLENADSEFRISKLIESVKDDFSGNTLQSPQGHPLSLKSHKGGEYVFKVRNRLDQRDLKGYDNFLKVLKLYKTNTKFNKLTKFASRKEKIGYEIYQEYDPIIKSSTNYLYLYSGIIQTKTLKQIRENKPEILNREKLIIFTEKDLSQSDPSRRLNNIKRIFQPKNALYIDDFIRDICSSTLQDYKIDEPFLQISNFVLPLYKVYTDLGEPIKLNIDDLINSWSTKQNDPIIVIKGIGGIGKTTFAQYITDKLTSASDLIPLFIDSVLIRETLAKKFNKTKKLSVYDFYDGIQLSEQATDKLTENQFNLNLDAGNVLIIIDGLDEVISKIPGFAIDSFIDSIKSITDQIGSGKVIITCRTHFWNPEVERSSFQVIELNPFSKEKAVEFFSKSLQGTRKRHKAMELANDFKLSESENTYHPYILDIIRSIVILDQEDLDLDLSEFNSQYLNSNIKNDYIVYRVCEREVRRIGQIMVDDQVKFFKFLAMERRGNVKLRNFSREVKDGIKKTIDNVNVEAFKAHPFLLKTEYNIGFKYDFFSEIFKAIEIAEYFNVLDDVKKLKVNVISILSESCWFDSGLNIEVAKRVKRWGEQEILIISDLIDKILSSEFLNSENRDFAAANLFNIALKINHRNHQNNIEENTKLLTEIFGIGNNKLSKLRIIGLNSDKPIRFDFSNLEISEAVIDNYTHFYRCEFDQFSTKFINCHISNVSTNDRLEARVSGDIFINCKYDQNIEMAIKEHLNVKIDKANRTKQFLFNFLHLFYSNGRLGRQWEDKVIKVRYDGINNAGIPYKKVIRILKREELLRSVAEKEGVKMFIDDQFKTDVTKFVKDGTMSKTISQIIRQLS